MRFPNKPETDLLQLGHVLGGGDALVKQTDQGRLEVVQVGAVVAALLVHHEVHQEQAVLLGPGQAQGRGRATIVSLLCTGTSEFGVILISHNPHRPEEPCPDLFKF